jgi:hypothetical protein
MQIIKKIKENSLINYANLGLGKNKFMILGEKK